MGQLRDDIDAAAQRIVDACHDDARSLVSKAVNAFQADIMTILYEKMVTSDYAESDIPPTGDGSPFPAISEEDGEVVVNLPDKKED